MALNRSKDSLEKALAEGTIDTGVQDITPDFRDCDLIFLCTPVETNISFLEKLKPYLGKNTILTDVGSVKSGIHEAVERIVPEAVFIGGHPMAGKEKVMFDNASEHLMKGAYYYLTPSKTATDEQVGILKDLVEKIEAKPVIVEPNLHDFIVAAISHVPHMAAYALVKLVKDEDIDQRIKNCILMHHEFKDGSGYPLHLKGDKIDEVVSIVTVSNIYDEMTSRRTYRAPICPFTVISQFEKEGINKFDPNVIMTFLGNIANTFIANRVMLNTGQTGEIIFVNADHLSRPVVKCGENYVDLSSNKSLSIVAVI